MTNTGPLAGIEVVEMANVISGPFTSMLLADLGASVTKVEMPRVGDVFRVWDGHSADIRAPFAAYNRGKRSVTLDVRREPGQEAFRRIVAGCDVVVENFRPGVLDRWGIGYDVLAADNPGLVYCDITGMGSVGPYRDRPTYDAIAQALGGLWSQFTDLDDPEALGPAMSDQLTSIFAAYGILAALVARERDGRGQRVEVSMLGATVAFLGVQVADFTMNGNIGGKASRAQRSQSYAFVSSDGLPFAIHLSTPQKFWAAVADSVGRPELETDPRFRDKADRIRNYDELHQVLTAEFRKQTRAYWLAELSSRDVPSAPINDISEVIEDPQVNALDLIRDVGSGSRRYRLSSSPVRFGGATVDEPLPPPLVGEHTSEVLAAVGYSEDEIRALAECGAI